MHVEDEVSQEEVAEILNVTPSRVCQIVQRRIKPAMEAAYLLSEALDLYRDDPDASRLVVDWIKL